MQADIIILDFGSQYTQLIGRKVRELGVYCEIWPYHRHEEALITAKAIILSGSPFSALDEESPTIPTEKLISKIPCLGICFGAQMIAQKHGGEVARSAHREYGRAHINVSKENDLLPREMDQSVVWMSHGDTILALPEHGEVLASSSDIPIASYRINGDVPFYGVQFHPEVTHTDYGKAVLDNFMFKVCKLSPNWTADGFIDETVALVQSQIGDHDHVLMALSGGVDSTVTAALLHKAIGDRLHCVFVDNGLLRWKEFEEVASIYTRLGLNIHMVDAKAEFYAQLAGQTDPEAKRKIIGRLFIEIFEEEARDTSDIKWLGQGTIYPDVIESISVHGPSVMIKSHHNVGGLPEKLGLKIIEPLRSLFKDEVRRIGQALNIPNRYFDEAPISRTRTRYSNHR